uniref:CARD domain-containing protein n=1 Tax=Sphenodon punctatus TaxID=8508 RepID=A0A8D0GGA0_SPHPU
MSAAEKASEVIRKERKKLIEILQKDVEPILDELVSQSIISVEEYEILDNSKEEPKKKARKMLILIQKKGETLCQQFLDTLEIVHPSLKQDLQFLSQDFVASEEKVDTSQLPEAAERDHPKGIYMRTQLLPDLVKP